MYVAYSDGEGVVLGESMLSVGDGVDVSVRAVAGGGSTIEQSSPSKPAKHTHAGVAVLKPVQ